MLYGRYYDMIYLQHHCRDREQCVRFTSGLFLAGWLLWKQEGPEQSISVRRRQAERFSMSEIGEIPLIKGRIVAINSGETTPVDNILAIKWPALEK